MDSNDAAAVTKGANALKRTNLARAAWALAAAVRSVVSHGLPSKPAISFTNRSMSACTVFNLAAMHSALASRAR